MGLPIIIQSLAIFTGCNSVLLLLSTECRGLFWDSACIGPESVTPIGSQGLIGTEINFVTSKSIAVDLLQVDVGKTITLIESVKWLLVASWFLWQRRDGSDLRFQMGWRYSHPQLNNAPLSCWLSKDIYWLSRWSWRRKTMDEGKLSNVVGTCVDSSTVLSEVMVSLKWQLCLFT